MSEEREREAVRRLLNLIARQLEEFVQGDELALESLGGLLEDGGFSEDQVQAAVLTLRSLAGGWRIAPTSAVDPPGRESQRVLNEQERGSLSPEAWGYLLDLKRLGSLDAGQFECVLDRLSACGVRPVGVEMAHQMAVRVALAHAGEEREDALGENDLAH
jgi:uncharacterized protein Smg (DUF494 family)